MSGEGQWSEPLDLKGKIWVLKCGPVFAAEISYLYEGDRYGYCPRLNGERLGFYGRLEEAKARCEWEIYNRVRQMIGGYKAILERRQSWQTGSGTGPFEKRPIVAEAIGS